MRFGLRRRRAADQRRGVYRTLAAGAVFLQVRRTARGAEGAAEILRRAAASAALKDDRSFSPGPVGKAVHLVRSRTMLTCEDSTPPSPCSSASDASRTWRSPARPVICRWVSTGISPSHEK